MIIESLKSIFKRDLEKLYSEIDQYKDEKKIWYTEKSIANSAGNLCLHLIGNLNAFIGAELGKTGYIRNRPLEFSLKDVPKKELLQQVMETISAIDTTLDMIEEEQLNADYPLEVFGYKMTTGFFLIHLSGHLSYHLGQVNYHRRLLDA
jgi:uncharacterized damage-inducible protein DinB